LDLAFRQISQAETLQGSIQQRAGTIEDELTLYPHVEFAPVLLEFPGIETVVSRPAEVDAVVACKILRGPRLLVGGEVGRRGIGAWLP
jgi:hypothetical protein